MTDKNDALVFKEIDGCVTFKEICETMRESICKDCDLHDICTRKTVFKFDGVCNLLKVRLTFEDMRD